MNTSLYARARQGCRARDHRDVFMSCPEGRHCTPLAVLADSKFELELSRCCATPGITFALALVSKESKTAVHLNCLMSQVSG